MQAAWVDFPIVFECDGMSNTARQLKPDRVTAGFTTFSTARCQTRSEMGRRTGGIVGQGNTPTNNRPAWQVGAVGTTEVEFAVI